MGCCGYERVFGARTARHDARRYRKRGPKRTQASVIRLLRERGVQGAQVLEIGGGIGAIQVELLHAGAARTTNVELSSAYETEAAALLRESGLEGRAERLLGDLVTDPGLVAPADAVVLERVLCCYPDLPALLGAAADRARRSLVASYPRRNPVSRAFVRAANLILRLWGRSFRVFVHDPAEIERVAAAHGLMRTDLRRGRVWEVAAFDRPA